MQYAGHEAIHFLNDDKLPHKTLELTDDFKEVVDGKYAIDLATRQAVLQSYEPESKLGLGIHQTIQG